MIETSGKHPTTRGNATGIEPPASTMKRRNWSVWYRPPVFVRSPEEALAVDHEGTVYVSAAAPQFADLIDLAGAGWDVYSDGRWPTLRRGSASVRWVGAWMGEPATGHAWWSPTWCAGFWQELTRAIGSLDRGAAPIGAPATTGRDLWLRTLGDRTYPTMSADAQDLVREIAGQGRIEVLPDDGGAPIKRVRVYDARLAYLSMLRELPVGEPEHVDGAGVDRLGRYARAFYRCTWQAPAGWTGPGILPARSDAGVTWPAGGAGWASAVEVDLARDHGWSVEVEHAIHWPATGEPFRAWRRLVGSLLDAVPAPGYGRPWRHAIRAIMLHTIGAMVGAPRRVTRWGTAAPAVEVEGLHLVRPGVVRWTETAPALWPETHHPEWSATVWARARARLLDAPAPAGRRVGALATSDRVLGFRTDAIYLANPREPVWPDDGRLGRYKVKCDRRVADGAWPANQTALRSLAGER